MIVPKDNKRKTNKLFFRIDINVVIEMYLELYSYMLGNSIPIIREKKAEVKYT